MTPEEEARAVCSLMSKLERVLACEPSGIVARALGVTIGRVIYGLVEIGGHEAGETFGSAVDAAACSTIDHLRDKAAGQPVRH